MAADPFETRAALLINETERKLLETMLFMILDSLSWIETVSNWLLAITGASFPLLLSNADRVLPVASLSRFRIALAVLGISALFGLAVRVRGSQIVLARRSYEFMLRGVEEIWTNHSTQEDEIAKDAIAAGRQPPSTDIEFPRVVAQVKALTPWYARPLWDKHANRAAHDITYALKRSVRQGLWYSWAVTLQVAAFLMAILFLVVPSI
jgi:hypothetical protein